MTVIVKRKMMNLNIQRMELWCKRKWLMMKILRSTTTSITMAFQQKLLLKILVPQLFIWG